MKSIELNEQEIGYLKDLLEMEMGMIYPEGTSAKIFRQIINKLNEE